MSPRICRYVIAIISILMMNSALAMICVDQRFMPNQVFEINEQTGYSYQINNPMNNGQSFRDPTGQFYMRLPAANPHMEAYFAGWNGQLILLNVFSPMPQQIGYCQQQNSPNYSPPPPAFVPQLQPSQFQVTGVPGNAMPLPAQFAPAQPGYSKPAYATEQQMAACLQQTQGNTDRFMDCAARKMFNPQQVQVYDCVAKAADDNSRAQCLAGVVLGPNERRVFDQIQSCNAQNNGDWNKLPLCMASQQFDPNTQKAINCLQQQWKTGQVSAWGTVACAASGAISMNQEMTIAVQCAATSGGNPMAWAGCTGGQLTANELNKCLTNGVGGADGCFGPNNTIVQALNEVGELVQNRFGPTNDMVKTFNNAVNDITHGPGPTNDLAVAATTIVNDLQNGPGETNDIRKAINDVIPGIW